MGKAREMGEQERIIDRGREREINRDEEKECGKTLR